VVTPTGKPGTLADTATVTAGDITSSDSDDSATATVTVRDTSSGSASAGATMARWR
jgi:hypothetical protein